MSIDRKPAQIARDHRNIGRMYLQGAIQADIAKELKISQATVSREIKSLIDEWRKERVIDINEAKMRELSKLDNLELEYWGAWKKSQEDAVTYTTGRTPGGDIATEQRKGQAGEPRFLDGVMKCIEKRCDILGVKAPAKVDLNLITWKDFISGKLPDEKEE